MPNIHIGFDFWGAGNCGDDLMLAGFTQWMSQHQKEWQISCLCAHDIQAMRHRFPSIKWYTADEHSRESALKQADIWLGLGAGVFQTDVGMWLLNQIELDLKAAAQRGIPSYFVGVGINNIEALLTPQAQTIHHHLERIWVRDNTCLDAMLHANFSPEKVVLGADLAHLSCATRTTIKSNGAAIALIVDPSKVNLRALARELILQKATWICQEVRDLMGSELNLYTKLSEDIQLLIPFQTLNYATASLDEIFNHMMSWANVLTSRYHTTLAAAWTGSNITVYDRNTKLTGIRTELALPQCSDLTDSLQIKQAMRGSPVELGKLLDCRNRAEHMLEDLFTKLNKGPC